MNSPLRPRRTSISILTLLLAAGGCAHAPAERTVASEGSGQWSGLVRLKDLSMTYPGDHDRPRPGDGWWVTPIHANLLPDGKVLVNGWSRGQEKFCGDHKGRQNGTTFVVDPSEIDGHSGGILNITPIPEMPKDPRDVFYCAGHVPLADGRVLFTGGARYDFLDLSGKEQEYGLNYARVFNPASRSFSVVPATSPGGPHPSDAQKAADWAWYEQGMMWYPTNTRIPGGRVLVTGGFAQQNGPFEPEYLNNSLVTFDANAYFHGGYPWREIVPHEQALDALDTGSFDYPHAYLLYRPVSIGGRDRQVAIWGGKKGKIAFLNIDPETPSGARLALAPNSSRPAPGYDKTSLILPSGEIFVMGGGANGGAEGQRIDIYDPYSDRWRSVNTGITRIRPASLLLPDGKVLILSGEAMWPGGGATLGDRRQPTLFDPATGTVDNLPPWAGDNDDRGYHNLALLLKDGRVLVGGGRTLNSQNGTEEFRIGCERPDLRIFTPPYLMKGPRPVIQGLSDGFTANLGSQPLAFQFAGPPPRAKGGVVLMALGAETHHFDQNQRYVPVDYTIEGPTVRMTTPADEMQAPEGMYNLFLVSDAGVPSVAKTIRLRANPAFLRKIPARAPPQVRR